MRALEGDVSLDDLNEGVRPGQSSIYSGSSDYDTGSYHADMKKFTKMAFSSPSESSDYGATGEFRPNPSTSSGSDSREMSLPAREKHNFRAA